MGPIRPYPQAEITGPGDVLGLPALLRAGLAITVRGWLMWLLHLLILLAFVPALALLGGATGALTALSLPWAPGQPHWLTLLRQATPTAWLGLAGLALAFFAGNSGVVLLLQAVALRAARLGGEPGQDSLRQAFGLGLARLGGLARLSLLLGMLLTALSLTAAFQLAPLPAEPGFNPAGLVLGLAAVGLPLGLLVFMLLLAMVLDNLAPGAAARQALRVFRLGWRGFLPVFAFSCLPAAGLLLAALFGAWAWPAPLLLAGNWVALAICGVLSPLGLYAVLFICVYSLVLHTLMYRAASQALGGL